MKCHIFRWLYRRYYRQAVWTLLCTSVCFLVVCQVIRIKHAHLQENSAWDLKYQQSRLNFLATSDITMASASLRVQREVSFQGKNSTDDHFSSPFVVTDSEVDKFASSEIYNELTDVVPEATRNKTFTIIWPCKGGRIGCFINKPVPVETCRFPCQQIRDYEQADVAVFNVFRFRQNEAVPRFNRPRTQRWVMMTGESPVRWSQFDNLDYPAFKGQFNWTMTYRLDSDIPFIYGKLQRQASPAKDYDRIYRGKTVTAAWFVSHCFTQSRRDLFVRRMQRIVDVHVFGSCGNYTCGDQAGSKRDLDKSQCFPLLSKKYFFYLAFENSFCKDYVTEKFFKLFGDVDVVPVVRGGADYKKNFPGNTFIDASDFKSPEKLGAFLLEMAKDKKRYISMLKDKNRYGVLPEQKWFCDLCEKMHKDDRQKYYPDLRHWFLRDQCYAPKDV